MIRRQILRYTSNQRTNHWLVAIFFLMAALSGLALFHPALFWLSNLFGGGPWTRILHPFMGVVMFVLFLGLVIQFFRANIFITNDRLWLRRVGRVIRNEEEGVPAIGKYNPGQKLLFWILLMCMLVLLFSGLVIWREYFSEYFGITSIRWAMLLHALAGLILVLSIIVHIYAGIWIRGSVSAMTHGWVSRAWARRHHELWYREVTRDEHPDRPIKQKRINPLATILEPGEIEAAASSPPFLHLPPNNLFTFARLAPGASGRRPSTGRLPAAGHRPVPRAAGADGRSPVAAMPDAERMRVCQQHGLPPFAADSLVREDHWLPYLEALLQRYQPPPQPAVEKAVATLRSANVGQRKAWAIALVSGQFTLLPAAVVPFLGAALQVAWSHWLLSTPDLALKPGDSLSQCPACGSPAMAGVIRIAASTTACGIWCARCVPANGMWCGSNACIANTAKALNTSASMTTATLPIRHPFARRSAPAAAAT